MLVSDKWFPADVLALRICVTSPLGFSDAHVVIAFAYILITFTTLYFTVKSSNLSVKLRSTFLYRLISRAFVVTESTGPSYLRAYGRRPWLPYYNLLIISCRQLLRPTYLRLICCVTMSAWLLFAVYNPMRLSKHPNPNRVV